jgi:hypothetical protein
LKRTVQEIFLADVLDLNFNLCFSRKDFAFPARTFGSFFDGFNTIVLGVTIVIFTRFFGDF